MHTREIKQPIGLIPKEKQGEEAMSESTQNLNTTSKNNIFATVIKKNEAEKAALKKAELKREIEFARKRAFAAAAELGLSMGLSGAIQASRIDAPNVTADAVKDRMADFYSIPEVKIYLAIMNDFPNADVTPDANC